MYSVNVRDHFMIAHSFGRGLRARPAPARRDLRRRRGAPPRRTRPGRPGGRHRSRDRQHCASCSARSTTQSRRRSAFAGRNTTTEFLARAVFDRVRRHRGRRARAAGARALAAAGEAARIARRVGRVRGRQCAGARGEAGVGRSGRQWKRPSSTSSFPAIPARSPAGTSTTARSWMDCVRSAGTSRFTGSTRPSPCRRPRRSLTRARCSRAFPTAPGSSWTDSRSAPCPRSPQRRRAGCGSSRSCTIRSRSRPGSRTGTPRRCGCRRSTRSPPRASSSRPAPRPRAHLPITGSPPSGRSSSSRAPIPRRSRAARAGACSSCCACRWSSRGRDTRCSSKRSRRSSTGRGA